MGGSRDDDGDVMMMVTSVVMMTSDDDGDCRMVMEWCALVAMAVSWPDMVESGGRIMEGEWRVLLGARKTVRLEPPMPASMEPARFHAATPITPPPHNPTYIRAPLGHSFAAAARAPRGQYDFVDIVEAGQGLIRSPGHDTRTIARAADIAEDVGAQVRKQESEIFYTQLHDARTDRRDIRLKIDVVRGQRTAYETEFHEVRHAYLSSEAQNRVLLARLETMETHMSRMKWQRRRAEDDAVRQIMRTQVLEARARIDTVEDTGSSC
ncbi:hypothetical protein Tco_0933519 [Tanacetum coccineum]